MFRCLAPAATNKLSPSVARNRSRGIMHTNSKFLVLAFTLLIAGCERHPRAETARKRTDTTEKSEAKSTPGVMDDDHFWSLIAESREATIRRKRTPAEGFMRPHIEEHTKVLRRLSAEDLVAYQRRFDSYLHLAYRW